MSDVTELARLLQELDDQLVSCMKCGMCQAACPLYAETGRETDVARGKLALVESLAHEILRDPEGVKERLDKCLLCGSCAQACPSGVKVLDIFLKARAIITEYLGLSPLKKAIFRGMLSRPRLFGSLLQLGSRFQGVFSKPANELLGSSCARIPSSILADRHFLPLSRSTLHKQMGGIDRPAGSSGLRVAFYPGCLVDKIFPRIGLDVLHILKHHGVGVFMPRQQVCCGIPSLSSGDRKSFEKLVHLNAELYAGSSFDYLVTPCATCTSTLRKIWPLMAEHLPNPLRNQALVLADKALDITELLADKLSLPEPEPARSGSEPRPITYHDPCHLRKSLNIIEQPRRLIRANPHYQLREMQEPERCCGMGGSFNLQHYDISRKIGQRKLEAIVASGADTVATGCPACMMQIADQLSQSGQSIRIKHAVEIYAEALQGQESEASETAT